MKDKPQDGKPAPSPLELLELLENPDDPASAEALRHLAEDETTRRTLDRLLAIDDALALEAWERAEREADARGPAVISSDLERRVLSVPDQSDLERRVLSVPDQSDLERHVLSVPDQSDLERRVFSVPDQSDLERRVLNVPNQGDIEAYGPVRSGAVLHLVPPPSIAPEITQPEAAPPVTNGVPATRRPRRTSGWRYPALALAASVLVAVGMWQVYREVGPTRLSEVEPPILRGDGTVPLPKGAPMRLLVAPPGSDAEPAELEELEPGRWAAQVPRNVRIQLQVNRPEGLDVDARWTAALSLWRKTAAGQRVTIDAPLFERSARAWEQSVDFPDIDLERGTSAWGFQPGDRLEMEVRRDDQLILLDVAFTPEGG